jgi:uncharacterized protein (TIGR03435 family)
LQDIFARMQPAVRLFLIGAALPWDGLAQRAGDIPPALVREKLKGDCPASLDWSSLHGNVVVVGFPSEFVTPDDIKEWNKLPEKFQGEPVVFIQVAGGSEFLVDQALNKTPYQGCVLFDSQQANRRNFGLPDFSRTVVVDGQGWIAGYTRGDISEPTVRSVITHHRTADLVEAAPQPQSFTPIGLDGARSYDVHISPAAKGEWRALGSVGLDRYVSKNQALKCIIADLWETPLSRIAFPDNLDEASYDVTAHIPVSDSDLLLKLVRQAVEAHFGLIVQKETRSERVYVIAAAHSGSQLRPATDGENQMTGSSQRSMIGTAQTMQEIARRFEDMLQTPVIDRTRLPGRFDYSATSELAEPASFFDMARQLGLQLTEAEWPVEMLVVRKF